MNDLNKNKSIIRTKKTTISLADILTEEGIGLIIPGGSTAYKIAKVLLNHAKKYILDRTNERINIFHEKILLGIPKSEQNDFIKKDFSVEEYYSLVNKVIQDEEDKKVEIYSKIFQCLVLDLIPMEFKTHVLRISRELSYKDFDLIRRIYISAHSSNDPEVTKARISKIVSYKNPLEAYPIQNLIRLGLLTDNKPSWPTVILDLLVKLLYNENDLSLESIGLKAEITSKSPQVFIAYHEIENNTEIFAKIGKLLFENNINYVIGKPNFRSIPLILSPITVICIGSKGNPLEDIKKHINLDKKIKLQLIMPGIKKGKLPLENEIAFKIDSINGGEIDSFVKYIDDQIRIIESK